MSAQASLRTGMPAGDLVGYQDAAIVSRTLLKGPAGSVTAFAFDRHQELSEHTAPYDALILLLDGAAEVRVAGAPHHLGAGDVLLLPANVPHAVKATDRFKMLLTMLRPSSA
jgi:quercetin dioxygenase-like cupin family protein